MKGLYKTLPPFAPDYSGACSILFELGGIVVIHDASGCTGNYIGYDEPRCYGSSSAIFTSSLREVEAIFGDDETIIDKIMEAMRLLDRKFVAILGSPATMVIGTDYKAIASIITKRTGLPALIFDTNGIDYYDKGASSAFLELAKQFVEEIEEKATTTTTPLVNIIGANPLDIGWSGQIESLKSWIEENGYRVQSCWSLNTTVEDIKKSAQAKANIVISWSGLETAKYFESKFGVPYVVGLPIGERASEAFKRKLASVLYSNNDANKKEDSVEFESRKRKEKVLIIGEQITCNSIRNCLRLDFGYKQVDVVSFFTMDSDFMSKEDNSISTEDSLRELMNSGKYDVIIGDLLFKELTSDDRMNLFIEIPHVAVSSRLSWSKKIDCIGTKGSVFFKEQFE
ncbi:MAG: nitrogenase component 1 [Alkaliphilus sp.]